MLNLVNWSAVNAMYCTLCWLVALGLALVILAHTTPGTDCAPMLRAAGGDGGLILGCDRAARSAGRH